VVANLIESEPIVKQLSPFSNVQTHGALKNADRPRRKEPARG